MQPAEFIAVIAFLFGPPLLLAFAAQTYVFAANRIFVRRLVHRAVLGYAATLTFSLVIGFAIHEFTPNFLSLVLRVRDISIGNQSWPVMPLAFVAVFITAIPITGFVVRSNESKQGD